MKVWTMLPLALPALLGLTLVLPCATNAEPVQSASTCQPDWQPTFGIRAGVNGRLTASTVFDDGGGPRLYASGSFTAAGGVPANHIASWDGTAWMPLGNGLDHGAEALVAFDDGSGAGVQLYAGGMFTIAGGAPAQNIAKWDGTAWSPLGAGLNSTVMALAVFDDGSGSALFAGGWFSLAGNLPAARIAKWDGTSWSTVGSGMDSGVFSLSVFDDGSGPALFAGGDFSSAGGLPASHMARWDGSSWSALGSGVDNRVYALDVFDDGAGPALFAGGFFSSAGGLPAQRVARWDGSSWSPLAGGAAFEVSSFAVLDDGNGPGLFVGGETAAGGGAQVAHVTKWDGASWTTPGGGLGAAGANSEVNALVAFDGSGGARLIVGGNFPKIAGVHMGNTVSWDGASWSPLGFGLNKEVLALTVGDDGSGAGPALFAGGFFKSAGGLSATDVARWNGSTWSPLGAGVNGHVFALALYDDGGGAGPALYAAGGFTATGGVLAAKIAKWDGTVWSAINAFLNFEVYALAVHDDGSGSALYVGGSFTTVDGVAGPSIARWDGTNWSAVGTGLPAQVNALAVYDDGNGAGPQLYAAGEFWRAEGIIVNRIARWDGMSWTGLDGGLGNPAEGESVHALSSFDDGTGMALYAGGLFDNSGGLALSNVARWDGSTWSDPGGGVDGTVRALSAHNDGTGSGASLYVGGSFTTAGALAAQNIARWNGSNWSALESGLINEVRALLEYDNPSTNSPDLIAGGLFGTSPAGDSFLASWSGCDQAFETYCTAGTSAAGCQALISASGIPSASGASGFDLEVSSVEGNKTGLFFFGANGRQANPWGNGTSLQCVTPPVMRGAVLVAAGTPGSCNASYAYDLNTRWNSKPTQNPGAGALVQAQFWYRDAASTSNQGTSLSDALEFAVSP